MCDWNINSLNCIKIIFYDKIKMYEARGYNSLDEPIANSMLYSTKINALNHLIELFTENK